MTLFVTLAADVLVAILLAAAIVTSLRLSRRIGQLKGDEAALRRTIGDLIVATDTAERAIAGLRATLDECDRTLHARIETADARSAELAGRIEAGEGVITRIGTIVGLVRSERPDSSPAPDLAPRPREAPPALARRPEPESPNDERLGAAAAAARAMTERALARVRTRAA